MVEQTAMHELRQVAAELRARQAGVDEILTRRNELIVQIALDTDISYEEIGEATGLSTSAVWKVTSHAGVMRVTQRVRQLPGAASG
jgi:hypothetical protein